jgi:hypothetical protein
VCQGAREAEKFGHLSHVRTVRKADGCGVYWTMCGNLNEHHVSHAPPKADLRAPAVDGR